MSFISDFISGFKEYVTQTWKNRPSTETPMSAERLNHIEAGIKSISDAIKSMASAIMKDMADLTIGASDWNAAEGEPGYVKNRTHWMEFVSKEEVILEETSVSFKNEMSSLYGLGSDKVIAGKPYIVHWNGTKYECTAFSADQSVFLGNGVLSGVGSDTGEPFCMEMLAATSAFVMKANSSTEIVKIKVETPEVVVYHKMDKEYLPDDIGSGGGGGVTSWNDLEDKPFGTEAVNILPETDVTYSRQDAMGGVTAYMDVPENLPKNGDIVVIVYNGTEYECIAVDEGGAFTFGDVDIMMGTPTGTHPFMIGVMSGMLLVVPADNSTSATVSIYFKKITPILSEYAPDAYLIDLVSLGLPTLTSNGAVKVKVDKEICAKILAMSEKGMFKLRLKFTGTVSDINGSYYSNYNDTVLEVFAKTGNDRIAADGSFVSRNLVAFVCDAIISVSICTDSIYAGYKFLTLT